LEASQLKSIPLFQTVSDDGVRLWVNNQLIIDNWTNHAATTDTSIPVNLVADQLYPIRLEYYEDGGNAVIRLRNGPAGGPYSPIPVGPTPTLGAGLYHCVPDVEANLLLHYRMDEASWSGTANEVEDSSGNGNHGTAVGGASTSGISPAIPGTTGTCRYGQFDGVDDYVSVPGLSNYLNGTASLAFWIRTTQVGNDLGWQAPAVTGVELAAGTDDIFWGWLDASGRIGLSVGNDFVNWKSTSSVNNGAWHHVVLTRDHIAGAFKIYVNGAL
jgi:MSHA biogenesis protein MshQ